MFRTLRQPKWVVATVLVLLLAAVFVRLGFWQLDRLELRRMVNETGENRMMAEPASITDLLAGADGDLESLEYRRVSLTGEFDPSEEVLIRSQVELGQAGFHVITPLLISEDLGVLVNRGWVPLGMDQPPVPASPPTGEVTIEAWVQLTQTRPPLGPEDPPGEIGTFNRVDVGRIVDQTAYPLTPVYVVQFGEGSSELPVTVDPPDFFDEGAHLAYAVQWFGFAIVGTVGLFFLLRRSSKAGSRPG